VWPDSPEKVDSDLFRDVVDRVVTFSIRTSTKLRRLFCAEIGRFVEETRPLEPVLIKTSTTGRRTADHEVSSSILELVIETVCGLIPASREQEVYAQQGSGAKSAGGGTLEPSADRGGWTTPI
jgi:hypothetical protein